MLKSVHLDEKLAERDTGRSFEGNVRKQMLVSKGESEELELLVVHFSAGARTRPHIHAKDQVLHFIQGRGIVATETEKTFFSAGDIVTVPGGTWHWHGATRTEAMSHVSIRQPGGTDWDVDLKNWGEY